MAEDQTNKERIDAINTRLDNIITSLQTKATPAPLIQVSTPGRRIYDIYPSTSANVVALFKMSEKFDGNYIVLKINITSDMKVYACGRQMLDGERVRAIGQTYYQYDGTRAMSNMNCAYIKNYYGSWANGGGEWGFYWYLKNNVLYLLSYMQYYGWSKSYGQYIMFFSGVYISPASKVSVVLGAATESTVSSFTGGLRTLGNNENRNIFDSSYTFNNELPQEALGVSLWCGYTNGYDVQYGNDFIQTFTEATE